MTTKINAQFQIALGTIINSLIKDGTIELIKLSEGGELIKRNGGVSFTGNINAGGNKITNLLDPVNDSDGVTKQFLESEIASAIASSRDFIGGFDASNNSFPSNTKKGDNYAVTVAGTIDGIEFNIGDALTSITDNASSNTYDNNWLKTDNTESLDILRTINISNNGDFTIDGSKLANRATIKGFVDSAINTLGTRKYGIELTVINGSPILNMPENFIAGTEALFINGNRQRKGASNDYTISGNIITYHRNLTSSGPIEETACVDYSIKK